MLSANKYQGEPTLLQVMRRPAWILALIFALVVAAAFASLAQWQMGSAVRLEESKIDSENVLDIAKITDPQTAVTEDSAGRKITFEGGIVDTDRFVVVDRQNFNEIGYWVIGHAVLSDPERHLVVTLGWSNDLEEAKSVAAKKITIDQTDFSGRYMPQDGLALPGPQDNPELLKSLSVGQIINLWEPFDGAVYGGYAVLDGAYLGLQEVQSVAPLPQEKINWLNLFYAVEWVVFAGFAVFFWYRLARDAWEKEHELKAISRQEEE